MSIYVYIVEVTSHSNFRSHKLSNKSLSQCQAREIFLRVVGRGEFRRPANSIGCCPCSWLSARI